MSANESTTKGAAILLIDEDTSFRRSIESLLIDHAYRVTPAANIQDALNFARRTKFDLVITKCGIDDSACHEIMQKFREMDSTPEIILMTSNGSVKNAANGVRHGAYDYISEPFKSEELLVLIEKALETMNLRTELIALREEIAWKYSFDNLVGESTAMKQLRNLAARIAATDLPVLITGESGTGKCLLAKAIHYHSRRRKNKFIHVDCSALPDGSLEAELSNRTEVEVTGKSLFEESDCGTLYLGEIGALPHRHQELVLNILQNSEVKFHDSEDTKKVDVRIIASSSNDLRRMTANGGFREDLFNRLNLLALNIPPLRRRAEDIAILAERFINQLKNRPELSNISITADAMKRLLAHKWPGNVRELENTIRRGAALSPQGRIREEDIVFISASEPNPKEGKHLLVTRRPVGTLEESLRDKIQDALFANDWNFSKTAATLGIGRTTLWRKIKKYNICREDAVPVEQD